MGRPSERICINFFFRYVVGIDGEQTEFEWHIFPGRTSLKILHKIQKDLEEQNIESQNFEDRIILLSMLNGAGISFDLEVKRNGLETQGKWQATANLMLEQFDESGHPLSKSVSPLSRGILRKKKNKETIHFTADALDPDLFYQTTH